MPTVGGINFGNEVQAQPQGSLVATLRQYADENTLVTIPANASFPRIGGQWNPGYDKVGARVANGGIAQVGVESGYSNYAISANDGQFYLEGLNFDHSAGNNNGTGIRSISRGTSVIKRVTLIGGVANSGNATNAFSIAATTPDSALLLERCQDVSRGTGYHTTSHGPGNGRIGIWSGSGKHEGLAHLKNCRVTDNANNALYASNLGRQGRFHVEGGIYEHSYGAQLRTGGNGTVLENAYIEVDMQNKSQRNWGGGQPGIRWEVKGKSNTSAGEIRNCHFRLLTGNIGQGIRLQRSAKNVNINGCRMWIAKNGINPIDIYGRNDYKFNPPGGFSNYNSINVNDLQVTGPAAGSAPVNIARG